MKLVSIEPTPSPNSMKLTLNQPLAEGERYTYSKENKGDAPQYIQNILSIEGVKSLYHVADFIALERNPKYDWQTILYQVRKVFGQDDGALRKVSPAPHVKSDTMSSQNHSFGEVKVFVQKFRDIPMQIKLLTGIEEFRIGLPERFSQAALIAQKEADNLILERKWVEQGVRYGDPDEVGKQVVEELEAAYSQQRLDHLVSIAVRKENKEQPNNRQVISLEEINKKLEASVWKTRYAALQQMTPEIGTIPLLKKALSDSNVSVRRLATAYLGEIDDTRVLPLLFDALKDNSFIIRRTAGDALSDLGDPQAIAPMINALKDKNKLVRWRAAMFLYEIGDETAIPALKEAQNDPEFEVQMQVKMALERIEKGEAAEGSVWQQMTRAVSKSDASE